MHVQVKLCHDQQCWYCPRMWPHVPKQGFGFFPYYSVPDGDNGWVPVHERHAMMQHPDEAVREVAHRLFVTDAYLPDNCVKEAWKKNKRCTEQRAGLVASATNLSRSTVLAMFEKLNEEDARRTDIARACSRCHSEAIDDPKLGPMLFCDHVQDTQGCSEALHLACTDPQLSKVPMGKWFCPAHRRTHAPGSTEGSPRASSSDGIAPFRFRSARVTSVQHTTNDRCREGPRWDLGGCISRRLAEQYAPFSSTGCTVVHTHLTNRCACTRGNKFQNGGSRVGVIHEQDATGVPRGI